jgi:hypothetical protein
MVRGGYSLLDEGPQIRLNSSLKTMINEQSPLTSHNQHALAISPYLPNADSTAITRQGPRANRQPAAAAAARLAPLLGDSANSHYGDAYC